MKSGPHYTLYYSACLQGPEEVGWGARGGLWWGLTSPWMIQQDVPRVPDLLTKAWPIWIHKHAQQTGVHIGTPQSLSYGNNAVGNLGPALVVDTLRWPLTSSPGPTPPFLHFIIIIIFLIPLLPRHKQFQVNENTVLPTRCDKNNDTPLHCLVLCVPLLLIISIHPFFPLQPPGTLGLCQINWGHPLILIHPTVLTVTQPHFPLQIALGKKFFQLLIFQAR